MDKARLEEFNNWWTSNTVDAELALSFKRDIFQEIQEHLEKKFITALTGLRRTGKTTIMYQLVQKLLAEDVSPANILFFSFDETSAGLHDILDTYKELHPQDFREKKTYIFLDEIQKHKDWENELKKYYDLYPKLKFVISGSESLFIKKRTKETLAGRIFEFILTPFTFKEFLRFNNVKASEMKYETRIKPFFTRFVERGGFPETFSIESNKDFKQYIKALVVDKIIYQDVPKMFNIEDPEFLGIILELISTNPGMYIDYQSLSQQFGKDRRVIKNYISYLKESFLLRLLGNHREGSITTLRKKKRAYPTDNALPYLYKPKIDESFFGRMAETLVINHLNAHSFWKNGTEVDIIDNGNPIEIKYQETISQQDFKSLIEFMRRFNKKNGTMITKKDEQEIRVKEGTIKLIPMWKFILQ